MSKKGFPDRLCGIPEPVRRKHPDIRGDFHGLEAAARDCRYRVRRLDV
jgi:hypothetical protein